MGFDVELEKKVFALTVVDVNHAWSKHMTSPRFHSWPPPPFKKAGDSSSNRVLERAGLSQPGCARCSIRGAVEEVRAQRTKTRDTIRPTTFRGLIGKGGMRD
jgi:hypothetical protein